MFLPMKYLTKEDQIAELQQKLEEQIAINRKLKADLDYVAMETDVDIDDEEELQNESLEEVLDN